MKVASSVPSLSGTAREAPRAADMGPDNAFDQLLSSLVRDMWSELSQLRSDRPDRAPEAPRSMDAPRQSLDRLESVEGKRFKTEDPTRSRPADSARIELGRPLSNAAPPHSGSGRLPARPAGGVREGVAVSLPRLDVERRNASQPTPPRPDSTPSKSPCVAPDTQHSVSAAPFRLTVTEIGGDVAIALRMPHPSPVGHDTLELQTRHAIGRYGLRTATLFINGVDRQIDAAGEENEHGD